MEYKFTSLSSYGHPILLKICYYTVQHYYAITLYSINTLLHCTVLIRYYTVKY